MSRARDCAHRQHHVRRHADGSRYLACRLCGYDLGAIDEEQLNGRAIEAELERSVAETQVG